MFKIGDLYTREDVAELIGYPEEKRRGGNWMTGGTKFGDAFYIFANIGLPGRTGHDYPNRWDGKELILTGRTGSRLGQSIIDSMISGAFPVHIFWRGADRAPFTYAGNAHAAAVRDTTPVEIIWGFDERATNALAAEIEALPLEPLLRRGPAPSEGDRIAVFSDRPTCLYILRLVGMTQGSHDRLTSDKVIVKIGISNAVRRRLKELNGGFPPGLKLRWELVSKVEYPTGREAFDVEGRLLEAL